MAGGSLSPPGIVSLDEAQEALAEVTGELEQARAAMTIAAGSVRGLQTRVANGDTSVPALQLLEARHALEVGERRVQKLEGQALAAREAAALARAHAVVDGWERDAPQLRAAIAEAVRALVAARDQVRHLTEAHNAASAGVQRALQGIVDPGRRFAMATFGHRFAGTESLRALFADGIVHAALATRPAEMFPPGLPIDVLPHTPPKRREAPSGEAAPRGVLRGAGTRVSPFATEPLEIPEGEMPPSVQRSPFFRRGSK